MPRVILYIATSLDGYIADHDGGVGWLSEVAPFEEDEDYGYAEFYATIGSVVMGRKTYEQVLGFGAWPYAGKSTYVFSTNPPSGDHPHVEFVTERPESYVSRFGNESEEDIWLVGGAGLVASFRTAGLIDEYIISVMPVLLGKGLPLFEKAQPRASLQLLDARTYDSGVVQLHYAAKEEGHR